MKPLKFLFYFFANQHTGLGHWFRSLALAQAALFRGHEVVICSNRNPERFRWQLARYNNPVDLHTALNIHQPDWLIVDLPHTLPPWIEAMVKCKVCTLNGIGYDQADNFVTLRVIQGVADLELPQEIDRDNTIMGIEYVIIRPEIAQYRQLPRDKNTLVWGGGMDHLGLMSKFAQLYPDDPALMVVADMTPIPHNIGPNHKIVSSNGIDGRLFGWMATAKRAVFSHGMVTWESAFLSTPAWVFSYSPLHLMFAQGMERAGLIKAYPAVGLPGDEEIRAFLAEPFEVNEVNRPNGMGADRVIREIEKR